MIHLAPGNRNNGCEHDASDGFETADRLMPPEKGRLRAGNKDGGIEMTTCGRVDASFGTARAKAVWINPGQPSCCLGFIHTLGPRAHDDHRFNNRDGFIETMPKKSNDYPRDFFGLLTPAG